MALDGSYAGLQQTIASWLNRSDLADSIPDMIRLAEGRFSDDVRLRTKSMERITSVTVPASGSAALPDDFLDMRMVLAMPSGTDPTIASTIVDEDTGLPIVLDPNTGAIGISEFTLLGAYPIKAAAAAWPVGQYTYTASGWPIDVYTINGAMLSVFPQVDATLALYYYARIPPLSDANPTNWLLSSRPHIYLYAALVQAAPKLGDDGRVPMWEGALNDGLDKLAESEQRRTWKNTAMRITGPTP